MNKNLQNGFILGAALQGKTEAIEPQGEIEITENGAYDVTEYATANVDVQSGVDCTELYNQITANEVPQDTNERVIDYVGKLVGVTEDDTN